MAIPSSATLRTATAINEIHNKDYEWSLFNLGQQQVLHPSLHGRQHTTMACDNEVSLNNIWLHQNLTPSFNFSKNLYDY